MKRFETKIYVTKKGYNDYVELLRVYEEQFAAHQKTRPEYGINTNEEYKTRFFDEQRDSFIYRINELKSTIQRLQILDESKQEKNRVNIEDVINIQLVGEEPEKVQLVGGFPDIDREDGILSITVNSPMGAAIYQKKIGERVSYKVGQNEFTLDILSKEEICEEGNEQEQ